MHYWFNIWKDHAKAMGNNAYFFNLDEQFQWQKSYSWRSQLPRHPTTHLLTLTKLTWCSTSFSQWVLQQSRWPSLPFNHVYTWTYGGSPPPPPAVQSIFSLITLKTKPEREVYYARARERAGALAGRAEATPSAVRCNSQSAQREGSKCGLLVSSRAYPGEQKDQSFLSFPGLVGVGVGEGIHRTSSTRPGWGRQKDKSESYHSETMAYESASKRGHTKHTALCFFKGINITQLLKQTGITFTTQLSSRLIN